MFAAGGVLSAREKRIRLSKNLKSLDNIVETRVARRAEFWEAGPILTGCKVGPILASAEISEEIAILCKFWPFYADFPKFSSAAGKEILPAPPSP